VLAEPLPAVAAPVPKVEALPDPVPPADEPPVPMAVPVDPPPVDEPPAPIVELDCAKANVAVPASRLAAKAAMRSFSDNMALSPFSLCKFAPVALFPSKEREKPRV